MKHSTVRAGKRARSTKIGNGTNEAVFSTKAKLHCASMLVGGLLAACGGGGTSSSTPTAVLNQGLWVANGPNVLEFVPSQLAGGTSAAVPHLMNNSSVFGAPQGVTFDSSGNLWVMDAGAAAVAAVAAKPPALYMFTAAQLAALA